MKITPIIILSIVLSVKLCPAQDNVVDQVVGVVGNNLILKSDIENQFIQLRGNNYEGLDLKCEIFEDLLYQNLLIHQAGIDSLEVTDKEVDAQLDRRLRYFVAQIGSEQKLEEYFNKSILEIKADFREDLRKQLLAEKMQNKITEGIKINPSEVRDFFKKLAKDSIPYIDEEIEYEQITRKPQIPEEEKLAVKEKLNGFRERILNGEKFSTLAVLYSEDPGSAPKGGELGFVGRNDLVPEFAAVAFNLKANEVSKIVETEYGFHIIQLIERRGEQINVRHILLTPKVPFSDVIRVREYLDSIATLVRKEEYTFSSAAEKFSDDANTKMNGGLVVNPNSGNSHFTLEQADPQTAYYLKRLKVGEISSPFEYADDSRQKAYKIIRIRNKIPGHKANLKDDYQRIQEVALANKKQKAIDNWIKSMQESTFIMVDDSYKNCAFKHPGWIKTEK